MVLMIRIIPDFPGGPMVKTLCFHCKGHGFRVQFLVMELRPFISYVMAKKKKIYIYIYPEGLKSNLKICCRN